MLFSVMCTYLFTVYSCDICDMVYRCLENSGIWPPMHLISDPGSYNYVKMLPANIFFPRAFLSFIHLF
ncbi:hypothetical protein EBL_c32430 [Shimwellia blattae DSM 4481 = NBRC 105725]|uniref:Uncharacterized protein n=1 Tax=Shimwellia blattae (strain ATCC 29907 / DSM 4481 / JCM 1650 / NBRC 105725 / CDC 9005-74) TaxID=630626 RepID=I2BCQ2_SHIBC|nr:hypothetical protein EBL_c32430 [Shimwellia blattae DSM 4481 = NBRC 105725]